MRVFVIFIVLIGVVALADQRNLNGIWRQINVQDGFEVLKTLKPVGFEPRRNIGDFDLYLVRLTLLSGPYTNDRTFGRLYLHEDGAIMYEFSFWGVLHRKKIDSNKEDTVEVLVTPPECLSWIPIIDNADTPDLPPRFLYVDDSSGNVKYQRAICRVWIENKKGLFPGYWTLGERKCWLPLDSRMQGFTTEVEILAYNEVSEVLPQCKS